MLQRLTQLFPERSNVLARAHRRRVVRPRSSLALILHRRLHAILRVRERPSQLIRHRDARVRTFDDRRAFGARPSHGARRGRSEGVDFGASVVLYTQTP